MQLERDEKGEAMDGFDRYEYARQSLQSYKEKVESPLKEKEAILLSALKAKDDITVEELDPDAVSPSSGQTSPETNNNNGDSKRNILNCFKSNGSSDHDEDPLTGFVAIDQQVWQDLMRLLIGPDRKTPIHWLNQSFLFNNSKLRYAFLQYKVSTFALLFFNDQSVYF